MNAPALPAERESRGASLWYEGERLRFRARKGAFRSELRSQLPGAETMHPLSAPLLHLQIGLSMMGVAAVGEVSP
jgi:TubC N-terminal docking domain